MSIAKYANAAITNVQEKLAARNTVLPTKRYTALRVDDVSPGMDQDGTTYYQELVGVLRWAIELGQIDTSCKFSMLLSHLDVPREGHLQQALHVFEYLKQYLKKSIYFNIGCTLVPPEGFHKFDCEDFYGDAHQEIPPDAADPRGHAVPISCFVDADTAANRQTCKP